MSMEEIKAQVLETVEENIDLIFGELYSPEDYYTSDFYLYGSLDDSEAIDIQSTRPFDGPDTEKWDFELRVDEIGEELENPREKIKENIEELLADKERFKLLDIEDPRKKNPTHRPTFVAIESLRYLSETSATWRGISKSDLKDHLDREMNNSPSNATLTRVLNELKDMGFLTSRGKKWSKTELLKALDLDPETEPETD